MFGRVGVFAFRFRAWMLPGAVGLMLASLLVAGPLGGRLQSGGYSVPGSPSQAASNLLTRYFGSAKTQLILVFRSASADVRSAAVQQKVDRTVRSIQGKPGVGSVLDYTNTHDPIFFGGHGHDTFAVINLNMSTSRATQELPRLESYLSAPAGLKMYVTGAPAIDALYNQALEQQLRRAELIALPVSLILLVLVFGSVVAALLPLIIAGLAVPTALGVIQLLAAHLTMSIFVTNVATLVGLGLAIDYSLFFVKRFREELPLRGTQEAVRIATASAGKAVTVSGTAVAVGLSSLTLFPVAALASMGIGGVVVVASTLLFALTALPAMLSLLGPRINRLSVRRGGHAKQSRSRFWPRLAGAVMRRPLVFLIPTVALLLGLGLPFLQLRLSTGSAVANIPPGPARTGYSILSGSFPQAGGVDDVNLVVRYPGLLHGRLTALQQTAIEGYVKRVDRLHGADGVSGALDPPPGMTVKAYRTALATAPSGRSRSLNTYIAQYLSGPVAQFNLGTSFGPDSTAGARLVHSLRGLAPPSGAQVLVGGGAAQSVDFLAAFGRTIPWAVLLVVAVTMVVLFLTFGSVVLPIKAVLMSLISISAAFGAMVWIFQEGHLSNLLQFTPAGSVTATIPVLMFAILFGLSMDYEVFLLSRIRESYVLSGDNRRAVAEGLGLTGGVITSAALIMITVFAAFAVGRVLEIQTLGVGMAIAVAVDASLVRGVVVPALMRILGRANWWAPPPLQQWISHLGFYERGEAPLTPVRTVAAEPARPR